MDLSFEPASGYSLGELADLMTRGFAGYFVPIRENAAGLSARVRREDVDLHLSRVVLAEGEPVALALINARGWTARLGAMGVVEQMRGRGVGRRLMDELFETVRREGFRRMTLEVIVANAPAVALYEHCGFRRKRRLVGFERKDERPRPEKDPAAPEGLTEIDPAEAAARIAAETEIVMPWQTAPPTYLGWTPPQRAYRSGDAEEGAWIQISSPTADSVAIYSLAAAGSHRRRGQGRRLLEMLAEAFPGRLWRVPAVVPEGLVDDFLIACGFARIELQQFEMERDL